MKKWVKKDFDIRWEWHLGRLQGQENRGWYSIYWRGSLISDKFQNKKMAESWLGSFLRKANKLRAEYDAKHPGELQ